MSQSTKNNSTTETDAKKLAKITEAGNNYLQFIAGVQRFRREYGVGKKNYIADTKKAIGYLRRLLDETEAGLTEETGNLEQLLFRSGAAGQLMILAGLISRSLNVEPLSAALRVFPSIDEDFLGVIVKENTEKAASPQAEVKPETFETLTLKIFEWARDRGIARPGERNDALKQLEKMEDEVEELYDAVEDHDTSRADIALELGDVLVTVITTSRALGQDPVYCLNAAYEKIRSRKGKTVDGKFVKEEDL